LKTVEGVSATNFLYMDIKEFRKMGITLKHMNQASQRKCHDQV